MCWKNRVFSFSGFHFGVLESVINQILKTFQEVVLARNWLEIALQDEMERWKIIRVRQIFRNLVFFGSWSPFYGFINSTIWFILYICTYTCIYCIYSHLTHTFICICMCIPLPIKTFYTPATKRRTYTGFGETNLCKCDERRVVPTTWNVFF